eukprot:TRINITY_DN89134_c0_g1_i1.p1 TRINITY_DN89134_c0_g1~~TRINITY_DN89134_c0_g1_i1.p1  ORF type:complete len:311 (-),score=24.91 TRINITY_DN89134_c0_g1_i1:68-1000(-)
MVSETNARVPPDSPETDAPLYADSSETNAPPPPPDSPSPPTSPSQRGSGRPPFKACITDEVYVLPPSRMIPDNLENFIVPLPLTVGKELNAFRKDDSWSLIVETCKSCKFHSRAGCNPQKAKSALVNIRKFAQACQEPSLHIARFPTPDIYHRRGALEVYLLPPVSSTPTNDAHPPIFLLHSRLVTRSWPTAVSLTRSMLRLPSMAGMGGLTVSVSEPEPSPVEATADDAEGQSKALASVDEDIELALEQLESDETYEPWQPEVDSGLLRLVPGDELPTPMSSLVTSPTSPTSPWLTYGGRPDDAFCVDK